MMAILMVVQLLSSLLAPKPKPPEAQQLDNVPTADPSRYVPVLFGTRTFSNASIVWYGDRSTQPHKTKSGKK